MAGSTPCQGVEGVGLYVCWQGVPYYFPDPPVGITVYPVITLNADDTITTDWGNDAGTARSAPAVMRGRKPKKPKPPPKKPRGGPPPG